MLTSRLSLVLSLLKVQDALMDSDWLVAMQEELNSFERNQVWSLVKRETTQAQYHRHKMDLTQKAR